MVRFDKLSQLTNSLLLTLDELLVCIVNRLVHEFEELNFFCLAKFMLLG